jgi:hypothetical protein
VNELYDAEKQYLSNNRLGIVSAIIGYPTSYILLQCSLSPPFIPISYLSSCAIDVSPPLDEHIPHEWDDIKNSKARYL